MTTRSLILLFLFAFCSCSDIENQTTSSKFNVELKCGDSLGSFKGVTSYYNAGLNSCVEGRHLASDGYSYGFRWQCVEFVRRFYKDHLNHEMSKYGNAADYLNDGFSNGELNTERNLFQYSNKNEVKVKIEDILVFKNMAKPYGHICIVKDVKENEIVIIEQNVGKECYRNIELIKQGNKWIIGDDCSGFLRKEE